MKTTGLLTFSYSLCLVLGGLMGFLKGGSMISLVMGGSFGLILLGLSYGIYRGKTKASQVALVLLFLLDGFFTYRFAKTLHVFPSGVFSLLSLGLLVLIALHLRKIQKGNTADG